MGKILLFGAGKCGCDFYQNMRRHPNIYTDEIIAFADNNQLLWHHSMEGIDVIDPSELSGKNYDLLVITSTYEKQIKNQLREMGVNPQKIYSIEDYGYKCYAEYQYRKKYGERLSHKKVFDKRIVVYTSITGNYDYLKEPLFRDDGIEYVCFTNNCDMKSSVWNIEYVSDDSLDNMYLAKKVKMFPDLYFKDYETSVWVDGKFLIKGDLRTYIEKYEKTESMICYPHFARNCIYEEMAECIRARKASRKKILEQSASYFQNGYPINNGLYEMGCIVRNHHDVLIKKLMRDWWQQIEKYSHRDQISFPYVCWKNGFKPDICDLFVGTNPWIEIYDHNVIV